MAKPEGFRPGQMRRRRRKDQRIKDQAKKFKEKQAKKKKATGGSIRAKLSSGGPVAKPN